MRFPLVSMFAATSLAANAQFSWNCTKSLGTCNNACYAIQHGLALGTLTYDSNETNRNPRRTASGCNKTPCTNTGYKKWGNSCDEYPFASVKEGGKNAILRCVDSTENSSEGGQLGSLYKKIKNGDKFDVYIEDYKGAKFCDKKASNDGSEFKLVNGAFKNAKVRRDLGLGFADVKPRDNISPIDFREFEGENGKRFLRLSRDPSGDFVGSVVYSADGDSTIIVREI